MNPDEIERAAIEAGALAAAMTDVNDYGSVAYSGEYHARTWDEVPPSTQAAIIDKHRVLFRAAIAAYNAAKREAGYHWECAKDSNSKPRPQPPEQKRSAADE